MINYFFALIAFAMPLSAFAQTIDPIEAFRHSPAVTAEVKDVLARGFILEKDAGAVLLGGSCGFAGCDSIYLVTIGYSTRASNPQTFVIAATVMVSPLAEPIVKMTSVEALVK